MGKIRIRRWLAAGLAAMALVCAAGTLAACGQSGSGLADAASSAIPAASPASPAAASPSADSAVPTSSVAFKQGGLKLTYETPTLQTEDRGGLPVSLGEAGSLVFDQDSSQVVTPVVLVPSRTGPPAMVIVMILSRPPAWLKQLKGMSASDFTPYLPTYEKSVRENIAKRVKSVSPMVRKWSVTSGVTNNVPAVMVRLHIASGGKRLDEEVRYLITRHDLYTVGYLAENGVVARDKRALQRAFESISVDW